MRKVLTVLLVGSMLFVLASCGSSTRSFVRIVNASPDAGTIDVTINGNKIVSALAYGAGSNYFTIGPGTNIDFKIDTHGTVALSFPTKITLLDKTYYTIAAVGIVGDPSHMPQPIPSTFSILQTTDDHTAPGSTDVKIRVLQLDPFSNPTNPSPVDAFITPPAAPLNNTAPNFSNLPFQSPASWVSVVVPTDGNLEIRVAPAGSSDPDGLNIPGWDSQTVLFKAGQVRTYILLNNPTGTPFPNQSLMLNDLN